ncbi:MAG: GTP-binding protein [Anaerolineales bacterium]|nr:GTP-binding protein [Anaerolineales bacterium]
MVYNSDMSENANPFDEYIEHWGVDLKKIWESLPEENRQKLEGALEMLPGDLKGWKSLIDQAVDHVRFASGTKQIVAVLGPANVGKSTLYNQFIRSRDDHSTVSAVPGTTRSNYEADAGIFNVVDTPGADAIGAVGEREKRIALQAALEADVLVLLFDATHGIRSPEKNLFIEMRQLDKPTLLSLNKMDLIPKEEKSLVLGKAAAGLGIPVEKLIPLSAKKGDNLDRLLLAIAKSEPEIVAALGAALPEYRWKLAQSITMKAASTAAAIAATPLPFVDFIPLIGIQTALVLGIARIYDYRITVARARELLATFGMAVLGRTLFYQLSKLGGPPAWLISAGVAAGTTAAIGFSAAAWFERGEKVSKETMLKISKAVSESVIDQLKNIGRRRTTRVTMRERIRRSLEGVPIFGASDNGEEKHQDEPADV